MRRLLLAATCLALPALASPGSGAIVAVDSDDVVPVATGVIARPGGQPGPCGPRDLVVLLRSDAERFLRDPTTVTTTTTTMPKTTTAAASTTTAAPPTWRLPLWAGPGLFLGEAEVFALAVDAALEKAKLTTTSPTTLMWTKGAPALAIATSASLDEVQAALRAFAPTAAWLQALELTVAKSRAMAARTPGVRALERVDARLCLGDRATTTTTTLSPAVVRAAMAAPLGAAPVDPSP